MRCENPINLKEQKIQVPCGRCYNCKQKRLLQWIFRLEQEKKVSETSYFLTLTYNNETIPMTGDGRKTLNKDDVKSFMKRLKKNQSDLHKRQVKTKIANDLHGKHIKYYLAAEYGGKTMRPHYHMIIFNLDLEALIGKEAQKALIYPEFYLNGKYQFFPKSWCRYGENKKETIQMGNITIGLVNSKSISYTCKYVQKAKKVPQYEGDLRYPEFSNMSKGLGLNYINQNIINWHWQDIIKRQYVTNQKGQKCAIPRYYKKFITTPEIQELIGEYYRLEQMIDYEKKSDVEKNKHAVDKMLIKGENERKIKAEKKYICSNEI